jgi:hypothetical protein
MVAEFQEDRREILLRGLEVDKPGLEVSPLYRPTALKSNHNVYYTDYTTAEDSRQKHSNYEHDEIMEIDFVWTPGKKLIECVPVGQKFKWAVSSHVLEHVPDPIGWVLEVFEVLENGGIFSLALPDKRFCYDKFRRETDVADLIDQWVRQQRIPSPRQIYDFLSRSVDGSGEPGTRAFEVAEKFEDAARSYTDQEALNFVVNSWTTGAYFDVHCSAFTPESFCALFSKLNDIGITNVEISSPTGNENEFYITLKKIGEPRVKHPGLPHSAAIGVVYDSDVAGFTKDLEHARKAFVEAIAVQENLKSSIQKLERNSSNLKSWVPKWARKILAS